MPWVNKLHSFGEEFSGRLAYRHTKVEEVSTHPFRNHLRPKALMLKWEQEILVDRKPFLTVDPASGVHLKAAVSCSGLEHRWVLGTSACKWLHSLCCSQASFFPICNAMMMTRCASLKLYSVMWRWAKVKSTCKFPLVPLRLSGVISVCCLAHVSSAAITGVPLPFSSQCVKMTVTNDPEDIYQGLGLKTFI